MPVTAPPRPSRRADTMEALHEQALIKGARERARRRHQRWAAAAAIATAIVAVAATFAMRADHGDVQPSAAPQPRAPAAAGATRSTIVFATWHGNTAATLYRINADGSGLHRLLSGSAAKLAGDRPSWPALSPDGRQVAFQIGHEPRTAIDVANLNGNNLHQIALGGYPTWSPDGTKIAYSLSSSLSLNAAVYVIRADGTARHRLARSAIYPSWSPDGTKLAYICVTPVVWDPVYLCVMKADGTDRHRIAPAENFTRPTWSPDGSKIAFLSGPVANGVLVHPYLYVINANGTNLRRLPPPVSGKNYDCRPAWSPDGKHIAFTPTDPHVDHTIGGIYLMNPNGRNVTHVKGTTGSACGISWQRTPA